MSPNPATLLTTIQELPFVNREEELALLKSLFDLADAGNGQVAFIGGEGGVGKTRLIRELGRYAKTKKAVFAIGPSFEEEGLVPYAPWIEAIRSVVQQNTVETFGKVLGRTMAEVGRLVPELAVRAREMGIKGWLTGPEESFAIFSAADADRVRLFQAVTDFLLHASRERPLVLFLDDVLWADAASLQLLHYFCRRIREQRIMVVAAYRDVELSEDHPLSRLLYDLNRERILRRVNLNRLALANVAEMVSNHMGGGRAAPEFAKLLHSRSGGNPFFLEEILRSLSEDGRVYTSDEGWTLPELERVAIPSTVRTLIKQRVSRLGPEIVETLSLGSVAGMYFPYELLRRVSGIEEEKLITQLEKAARAGLLKESRGQKEISYVFADEQIRDFLYDEFSLIRRRKTHARIAQAMEDLYKGETDLHLEELAHHFIQSGEAAKAAEYSLKAGERAARLHAYPEAKKHGLNVLDLLGDEQAEERMEVLVKVGDASYRMGQRQEPVEYYTKALAIANQLRQNRKHAQISSKLGLAYWLGENDKQRALEAYKAGLQALQAKEQKDTPEEAQIYSNIARLLVNTGEEEAALEWCHKAISIARKLDLREVLAQSLQTLALGLKLDRNSKAAILGYLEESLRLSEESGLEDATARAHVNLGSYYNMVPADYQKAKDTYLKGIEYSKKIGFVSYEAFKEAELALYVLIPLGEWDKALEVADHSFRMSSELGGFHVPKSLIPLGLVSLLKGNVAKAEDALNRAYPIAESSRWTEILYQCCVALGKLHIAKNDPKTAEKYLAKSVVEYAFGFNPLGEAYFFLLQAYWMSGDLAKAGEVHSKMKSWAEELDEKWAYAFERWGWGLISLSGGNWADAKDAFSKSRELWNQLRYPYNYAKTTIELARAFAKAGEKLEAEKCISEAHKVFTRLGAKLDLAGLESGNLLS